MVAIAGGSSFLGNTNSVAARWNEFGTVLYSMQMTDQETIAQLQQTVARAKYVVKEQMTEITRLRDEITMLVDWVMGDRDALTALQSIYLDPEQSPANRVKAAASAIGYERPKVVITGYANVTSLAHRLDAAPRIIEHSSSD